MANRELILVIDDNPLMLRLINVWLTMKNFELDIMTSSDKLEEYLEKKHPSVILLDIHIPDESVIKILERIKQKSPNSEVIIYATPLDNVFKLKFIKAGAFDFIIKKHCPDELIDSINRAIAIGIEVQKSRKYRFENRNRINENIKNLSYELAGLSNKINDKNRAYFQ